MSFFCKFNIQHSLFNLFFCKFHIHHSLFEFFFWQVHLPFTISCNRLKSRKMKEECIGGTNEIRRHFHRNLSYFFKSCNVEEVEMKYLKRNAKFRNLVTLTLKSDYFKIVNNIIRLLINSRNLYCIAIDHLKVDLGRHFISGELNKP